MYLIKIYSEPSGLFPPVEFRNGLNLIYGKKEIDQPKNSLNSIGKTTFLELIDFCLLSSFQKAHNPRLFSAKPLMVGYEIVLHFRINEENYIIKRNVENPNFPMFGVDGGDLEYFKINDLKIILANLIFKRLDYSGHFNAKWYRTLMSFYLKIQKFKQAKFLDPIQFIKEKSDTELNIYHFYLLGLDNTIPYELFKHRTNEKGLESSLTEIKKYVAEKYDIKNLKESQSEINRLRLDTAKLDDAIRKFELGEQYEDAEAEANKLTESIKNNLYENFVDREKIRAYEESFKISDQVNFRRITGMYNQISEELSLKIKQTLKDAIAFRKELSSSRKEFISAEVDKLKSFIHQREEFIKNFEDKRAKLFYFLSAKDAISDLTEAFFNLSEKKSKLSELESNTKILFDLSRELSEIDAEINQLKIKSLDYLEQVADDITKFYKNFTDVYEAIYINNSDHSDFSITRNLKKKSLIEIDVSLPDMFGKGKNQGRTLIYDLSILFYNMINTNQFPKFLIHDGVFDGVDKAHFLSICELIDNIAQRTPFSVQYITTLNEEGTLAADKFGDADHVDPYYVENNAILILSPSKKLFNQDF